MSHNFLIFALSNNLKFNAMKNNNVLKNNGLHNPDIGFKFPKKHANLRFHVRLCACYSTSSGINKVLLGKHIASFSTLLQAKSFIYFSLIKFYNSSKELDTCVEVISTSEYDIIIAYHVEYYRLNHDTDNVFAEYCILKG